MGAAFLVPAALSALSAGGQYINQRNASNRADTAEVQSIADQQAARAQANAGIHQLTNQIATDNPNTLAAKATGDYVSQLRQNAAGAAGQGADTTGGTQTFGQSTSSLPVVAGGSSRYNADTAASQKQVQDYGDEYANEMGQIDAASRMRQNEGLAMQTEAGNLNGLNLQSYGQNFVDQLRAQTAGQQNPWLSLASNIVGGAGNQLSKNPTAYFGGSAPPVNPAYMPNPGSPGSGYFGPLNAGGTDTSLATRVFG